MATIITKECINCGFCEDKCPNGAISAGFDTYKIDPELCTACVGFYATEACQEICPVRCCLPDPDRRESEATLIARALEIHPNDEKLRQRVASGDFPSLFRKK